MTHDPLSLLVVVVVMMMMTIQERGLVIHHSMVAILDEVWPALLLVLFLGDGDWLWWWWCLVCLFVVRGIILSAIINQFVVIAHLSLSTFLYVCLSLCLPLSLSRHPPCSFSCHLYLGGIIVDCNTCFFHKKRKRRNGESATTCSCHTQQQQ